MSRAHISNGYRDLGWVTGNYDTLAGEYGGEFIAVHRQGVFDHIEVFLRFGKE